MCRSEWENIDSHISAIGIRNSAGCTETQWTSFCISQLSTSLVLTTDSQPRRRCIWYVLGKLKERTAGWLRYLLSFQPGICCVMVLFWSPLLLSALVPPALIVCTTLMMCTCVLLTFPSSGIKAGVWCLLLLSVRCPTRCVSHYSTAFPCVFFPVFFLGRGGLCQGPLVSSICLLVSFRVSPLILLSLFPISCQVFPFRCVWLVHLPNVSHLFLIVSLSLMYLAHFPSSCARLSCQWAVQRIVLEFVQCSVFYLLSLLNLCLVLTWTKIYSGSPLYDCIIGSSVLWFWTWVSAYSDCFVLISRPWPTLTPL